jgi:surface protein
MKYFAFFLIALLIISCGGDDSIDNINQNDIIEVPTFTLGEVYNIRDNSVDFDFSVINNSESSFTDLGVVYGKSNNPTLDSGMVLSIDNEEGEYSISINNLDGSSTYFIRAYTKISGETFYSESISFSTLSQCNNIYDGNITLYTQEEVNEFGANNYCKVTGVFDIYSNSSDDPITTLLPLINLQSVGSFEVILAPEITTLAGLENLKIIEDNLFLFGCDSLENLDALSGFNTSVKRLFLIGCSSLQNLNGLSNITRIINPNLFGLKIQDCDSLLDLNGLSSLIEIQGSIDILYNESLISINALSNITNLPYGGIRIEGNSSLQRLNGLHNLTSVFDNISISGNNLLEDFSALSNVSEFGNYLIIENNNSLTSLVGLENLIFNSSKTVRILNNNLLQSLNGLEGLKTLDHLDIEENSSLTNLIGLSGLSIARNINIEDNNSLINLNGLSSLTTVSGYIGISDNELLENINSLDMLQNIDFFNCIDNKILSNFCGIRPLLLTGNINNFNVENNAYNPTQQDIIDGNCSL